MGIGRVRGEGEGEGNVVLMYDNDGYWDFSWVKSCDLVPG